MDRADRRGVRAALHKQDRPLVCSLCTRAVKANEDVQRDVHEVSFVGGIEPPLTIHDIELVAPVVMTWQQCCSRTALGSHCLRYMQAMTAYFNYSLLQTSGMEPLSWRRKQSSTGALVTGQADIHY